jgi:hypothetical protein
MLFFWFTVERNFVALMKYLEDIFPECLVQITDHE